MNQVKTPAIFRSPLGNLLVRVLGAAMESRFRYRFFGPENILNGADNLVGRSVLEAGCGTGYFTIPAARLIGDSGSLVAMDILPASVGLVTQKVLTANLKNVRVIEGDALSTGLDVASFDTVLLFGVIPSPMLPLNKLLPEIHRILRTSGNLAVWPPIPPGWFPKSVTESGLFAFSCERNGVHNFARVSAPSS
jgi:ubiquinone/menaquinone biosynthesis C-methylase UbiE